MTPNVLLRDIPVIIPGSAMGKDNQDSYRAFTKERCLVESSRSQCS
jgi:hypothetical protein